MSNSSNLDERILQFIGQTGVDASNHNIRYCVAYELGVSPNALMYRVDRSLQRLRKRNLIRFNGKVWLPVSWTPPKNS